MPKEKEDLLNVVTARVEEKVSERVSTAIASAVNRPDLTIGKISDAHAAVSLATKYFFPAFF